MNIQFIIKEKGFTQNEVAEKLGVTKSSFSQTVHNENTSVKMMRKIADVIGCKVGDFFRDEMSDDVENTNGSPTDTQTIICPKCGARLRLTAEDPDTDKSE